MDFQEYSGISSNSLGLIICDRDGTLIRDIKGISKIANLEWLPERIEILQKLTGLGFTIAIATNQGAIEEGIVTVEEVRTFNEGMIEDARAKGVDIWAVVFCPHGKNLKGEKCFCRKPRPGMLDEIVKRSGIRANQKIVFFGDQNSDLQAAQSSKYEIDFRLVSTYNFRSVVNEWINRP